MNTLLYSGLFLLYLFLMTVASPMGNRRNKDEMNSKMRFRRKDSGSHLMMSSRSGIRRDKRSIMQLNDIVKDVIGRSGMDFVGYGNWCGPGGGGQPVDPIDTCCAIHDFCYDKLVAHQVCPNGENGILYSTSYDWYVEEIGDNKKKAAKCGKNYGLCERRTCHCDTQIVNCFKELWTV